MLLKNQRILITGGTGFLGSALTERFLAQGAYVRVFSTGKNKRNIAHLSGNPRFSFISGDLGSRSSLEKVIKNVDLVVHFAAFTRTGETNAQPLKDFEYNVLPTIMLLDVMREHNVKRIIFASTGKVYGRIKYSPVNEKHPVNPEDPYSLGKYTCEKYLELYHKLFGVNFIILRLFGIYGPPQIPKEGSLVGVISIFVKCILTGKNLTIYGDGKLKRDFLYVDDFVELSCALIKRDLWQNTFNIASGKAVTLKKIVNILSKEFGAKKVKANFRPALRTDVDLVPDISLVKAKSGVRQKVILEDGIRKYIHWCKENNIYGS